MNTSARRTDARASGREQAPYGVAPPPTPVRFPSGPFRLARHTDAPRAVPPVRPGGPAVPFSEVPIITLTTGVAR